MQIIIDRFEGNFAVVELPDRQTVNLPCELFPGAVEGDVYTISKNEGEAAERKQRIQDKFNKLRAE